MSETEKQESEAPVTSTPAVKVTQVAGEPKKAAKRKQATKKATTKKTAAKKTAATKKAGKRLADTQDAAVRAAAPDLTEGMPTAEDAIKAQRARLAANRVEMVVVKEDVVEDARYPGTDRPNKKLRYFKGQVITAEEARRNNVKAVQQQNLSGGETK